MRIVYLLTSLGMGGAERQATALAARMADRGHEVALLVLRPRLPEQWPTPLRCIHLDMSKNPASVAAGMARARSVLLDFDPQLIHSHGFHGNMAARLLRLAVPGPVVLSTIHNVYEGGWRRMLAYRLTDGLSRRTAAISEAAASRFTRLGAVPARKCVVVPNAIELTGLAPDPERRRAMRSSMNAGDDFVWLAVGRIAPAKDYPTLLRAFARAHASRSGTRLWIAGEGSAEQAPFHGLAAELGVHEKVHWLGLRRDLPALLDAADGFAMSSQWEGMPLAAAEAMAMEKPVVATDVGGVRELAGTAGLLVPCRDPQALAAAMLDRMRQPATRRQALGRAARERILAHFDMEKRSVEWEELYSSLLPPAATA